MPLSVATPQGGCWDDVLGPAFGLGPGAQAPNPVTFVGVTRLLTFNPATPDNVDCSLQIPHDVYIPPSGNVVISPHVHWTFVAEPADGSTVTWVFDYVYGKIGGTFAASTTASNGVTYTEPVSTTSVRIHQLQELDDILIPIADFSVSTVIVGRLKLTGTVAADRVGLLSFDMHYQKGPFGTVSEFA